MPPQTDPPDWDPEQYGRFADLRKRPALDLLCAVPPLPPGAVVDLGCGDGAVAEDLVSRHPDREIVGVDSSPAMLAAAKRRGAYRRLVEADITDWFPDTPTALIFSNSVLHWIHDREALIAKLAGLLVPGGTLAVQIPDQYGMPSHDLFVHLADEMFPGWFGPGDRNTIPSAMEYERMLAGLGRGSVWETTYLQRLGADGDGHPVLAFASSTALRPFLARMTEGEARAFTARYAEALEEAYPREADGTVIFPFRRRFFTLTVERRGR
ncbi:MAG: methyltransferase domain-containing protein [Thermoleophilia bacterium]|nr:methyltransferase domain-containing protein [Thermoleophilia bacterium]